MRKINIFMSLFLFMMCLNVNAEGVCSSDELNRLKELANNVEIVKDLQVDDSRYDENNKNISDITPYYSVKLTNLTNELLVMYSVNNGNRVLANEQEIKNYIFFEGDKLTFYIYSSTNNSCNNKILKSIVVKFDKYNVYYYLNKDKCNNNLDFKYCKEYMDIDGKSYEEINKLFDEYLEKNKPSVNNNKLYYIIGGTVVFVAVVIGLVYKYKKNQL